MITNKNAPAATVLSVIVPVHDAETVLPRLFERLYPVLDRLRVAYEVVFVDDGSRDRSPTLLRQQHKLRSDATRVVVLRRNLGQQAAVLAGFEVSKGSRVITLDADLRSPPEEIPNLLAEMDRGHDYVGSIRRRRQQPKWRELISKATDWLRERVSPARVSDPGSMLRAYDREIVAAVLASGEPRPFIPVLAALYAGNPSEIPVEDEERPAAGAAAIFYERIRLGVELMTASSVLPLRVFAVVGMGLSLLSLLFGVFLTIRRLILGPGGDGVTTLFAILFVLTGAILLGVGLLAEYMSRINAQPPHRPGYLIRTHLRPKGDPDGSEG